MPFTFTTADGRTYAYESEVGNGLSCPRLTEVTPPEPETSIDQPGENE